MWLPLRAQTIIAGVRLHLISSKRNARDHRADEDLQDQLRPDRSLGGRAHRTSPPQSRVRSDLLQSHGP